MRWRSTHFNWAEKRHVNNDGPCVEQITRTSRCYYHWSLICTLPAVVASYYFIRYAVHPRKSKPSFDLFSTTFIKRDRCERWIHAPRDLYPTSEATLNWLEQHHELEGPIYYCKDSWRGEVLIACRKELPAISIHLHGLRWLYVL